MIAKAVVSIVVFRHVEYTLEAVAMVSILPPFQALVLSLLARSQAPFRRLPQLAELASRPSVRLLWVTMAFAVGVWLAVSTTSLLPGSDPRQLLGLVSGILLASAGLLMLAAGARRLRASGGHRLLTCGAACLAVALICVVSGLGFQVSPWPSLAAATAAVWVLTAAFLLLCLVRAARAVHTGSALLLETAAVLAAVTMSAVPLALYLRPYLGAGWLDPCRANLLLGAMLVLTASMSAESPRTTDESTAPEGSASTTVHTTAALWLSLQSSYLIGWLFLGFVLGGSPDLSPAACTQVVLIPMLQTLGLYSLHTVRKRGRPAT